MSEFTFDDGRRAEKVENNLDPMTKVIEVFVEPKPEKKLARRIIEKFCVCEREEQTIDEVTGEVLSSTVEKVCEGTSARSNSAVSSDVFDRVEKKISEKKKMVTYLFVLAIAVQAAVLAYVMFCM